MAESKQKEKAKFWGFRAFARHRKIVEKHAAKDALVSESEIIRRAIEEYDANHK